MVHAQTPAEVLDKAIQYHDPKGEWSNLQTTLIFRETRPDGSERMAEFELDNRTGKMKINRNDEEIYAVDGNEAEVLAGDYEADRGVMLRNYYLYLWGLPMKLTDEGTPQLTLEEEEKISGTSTHVVRVEYESDTWYFNFDQSSGRMVQYRFYKDEEAGKGELIILEDEIEVEGILIPQRRSWYTLPEEKFLGTDILERAE